MRQLQATTQRYKRLGPAATLLLVTQAAIGCAGSYRLDDQHPIERPAEDLLSLRWHRRLARPGIFDLRPQEWATAAIADDQTVFIGSTGERFVAIAKDGRLRWSYKTRGAISAAPLYDASRQTVYFGADDGSLRALDARDGSLRWQYRTQGTIFRAPVLAGATLLFTSSENRIYALDATSGRWRWQYDREAPEGFTIFGHAGVLVDGETALTGFSDGVLAALKVRSGEVLWTRSLAGDGERFVDIDATPVKVDGVAVTANYATGVHAVALDNGSVRWRFPLPAASTVAYAAGRIYVSAPRAGLVCLDTRGKQLWRQAMPAGVPSPPRVAHGYVLVSGTDSGLAVVSAADGELLQYFDPGHGISGGAALGQDSVAVLNNVGRLFFLRLR